MNKESEFIRIIKENEGVIFKITTFYADTKADREDLYQDIVHQLWKSYDSFRGEAKFSTWMYRIALNTALTRVKRKRKEGISVSMDKLVLRQSENYDEYFERQLKMLYEQIGQLNVFEKGIMLLLLEGKKYEEISEIMGISASNVGTRISRIKQKMKSELKN